MAAEIVKSYPPNYDQIVKVLPAVKRRPNAIFTYAPKIYHPAGLQLPFHFVEHEEVHIKQQQAIGVTVWWDRYLADPSFRLSQELEAYQKQWQVAKAIPRPDRRRLLAAISKDLSSEMYGKIISKAEAKARIQNA